MSGEERIKISVDCNLNLLQHLYFKQIILPAIWQVIDSHMDAINGLEEFTDCINESEEKE